jgi:hypothetical protein
MQFGNMPRDGGHLLLDIGEMNYIYENNKMSRAYLRKFIGSHDFLQGNQRACIWVDGSNYKEASKIHDLNTRFEAVKVERLKSKAASTRKFANKPYQFVQIQGVAQFNSILIPRHSSENREYLPVGLLNDDYVIADSALAIYDAPVWNISILSSKLHLSWIATVCGKIKTDYRYANTLGWNTFPLPPLLEKQKADLTRTAEDILLARERHFPATIAELYDPERMPEDLRRAHERNDEVLERIYIGRRFKNDTERLEKLFQLYTEMVG